MDVVLPKSGSYVVAVSGGVDSVALLDMLQKQDGLRLVVAHFDHGIREDSKQDRLFVQQLAQDYNLPFEYDEGQLGPAASEAYAREARYRFLRRIQKSHKAQAIVTAHHQDDVLETAIINLLRGSGRKGLTSLGTAAGLERPLLGVSKEDLVAYARKQGLKWREDITNEDDKYLRNYVRHQILPRFDPAARKRLVKAIRQLRSTNHEIDTLLASHLYEQPTKGALGRQEFNQLSHPVAREVLAAWLREYGVRDFDSKALERLVVAAKVGAPGSQFDVLQGVIMSVGSDDLALLRPER